MSESGFWKHVAVKNELAMRQGFLYQIPRFVLVFFKGSMPNVRDPWLHQAKRAEGLFSACLVRASQETKSIVDCIFPYLEDFWLNT